MEISKFDLAQLPRYQQRNFIPNSANLTDKSIVASLFNQLLERNINSYQELVSWILDRSELDTALNQTESILYIRMTCQTDDNQRAEAYQNFQQIIVPTIRLLKHKLDKKYFQERGRFFLDETRYKVYDQIHKADVDLFVDANVELQTEEALLSQKYQTICGAMTVSYQGKERTLPEMNKFFMENDRLVRESAWRATAQRRLLEKDKLDDIFDQMLKLRKQIAFNAKCGNFCDYQFRAYHRFAYTPEDCKQYHKTIEQLLVPIWKDILNMRCRHMGLTNLRPWDTSVDPLGYPPLKPFTKDEELVTGVYAIFSRIDGDLARQFKNMVDLGLLDLTSRKGKAPGGYQTTLAEARKPFIFMNAVGIDNDIRTLLHEAGHAFHSLACAHEQLFDYRHAPMEFNEFASMSMELLAGEYLDVFYDLDDVKRSHKSHLEDIIQTLVWVAIVDAFQHWIYENPDHTSTERMKTWIKIYEKFGGNSIDWRGLEEIESVLWHRQLHIFVVPFYYIEYGIAQLMALQLWMKAKQDRRAALAAYRKGLSLGGSLSLPKLYQATGLTFDFSQKTIAPLGEFIKKELKNKII